MEDVYKALKERVFELWKTEGLLTEKIEIRARALSTQEAIGNPEHQDFPIQKGKEKLMQATFRGAGGQAFTDMYGDYEGTLEQILKLRMENNHQRAVFVAALNAVLRYLGRIEGSIHCRDEEPVTCGKAIVPYLEEHHSGARIAQLGFQPRMVENLSPVHPLRVLDMDPENIGKKKFGVTIESAEQTEDAVLWADLLLATGTTLANGSIASLLGKKPIIFYGTTIAGAAHLMGWERFCPCSH
jgi:putative heavy-metal chelation protein